jgi:hypothetical protein
MKRSITIIGKEPYEFDNWITEEDFEYGIKLIFGEDIKIEWRDKNTIHISNTETTMFVTDQIEKENI